MTVLVLNKDGRVANACEWCLYEMDDRSKIIGYLAIDGTLTKNPDQIRWFGPQEYAQKLTEEPNTWSSKLRYKDYDGTDHYAENVAIFAPKEQL